MTVDGSQPRPGTPTGYASEPVSAQSYARLSSQLSPPSTNSGGVSGAANAAVGGASIRAATIACPTCRGPVDVRSKHVHVSGGAVRVYCSAECLSARDALPVEAATVSVTAPPKRRRWWLVLPLAVAAAGAVWFAWQRSAAPSLVPPPPVIATTDELADPEPAAAADPQREADAALVDELARDAWIHPLAGPERRMPKNHNGAFGAQRDGERPPECVSGHCGVDLGNQWGERVYAVHEGVIDFVNRGPNEDGGGVFVRIAHRGGTLFSWYFHLAAVPRSIRPGEKVSAGTVIGLLGDTGVKHSAPHLHFALSVRTSKHVRERYLDPEPLIAIWPLWIPSDDHTRGRLATSEPGLPMRASGGSKRRKKRQPPAESESSNAATDVPATSAAPSEETGDTGTSN